MEQSRYVASEWDCTFVTTASLGSTRPWLVWCHGNNATTLADYTNYYEGVFRLMAQRFNVVIADLGGSTFGNDTGIQRVGELLDHYSISSAYFLGASMGASVAINYAVRFPARVDAIACVIPALQFNDVDPSHPAYDELNLAYPPAYDEETHGPDYNPVQIADQLPADMPVALWTSSNDTTTPPSTADEFVAARPQTERTVFGAYGHGGITVAAPLISDWLIERL
jgi:hypothetical protein